MNTRSAGIFPPARKIVLIQNRLLHFFRFAWFAVSLWTSLDARCPTGSDSSALPGTARNRTWRRCRIYLADRYIFHYIPLLHTHFLIVYYYFFHFILDTWLNSSFYLSPHPYPTSEDFLPRSERDPSRRGTLRLVLERSGPVVRHPHHGHSHTRRKR